MGIYYIKEESNRRFFKWSNFAGQIYCISIYLRVTSCYISKERFDRYSIAFKMESFDLSWNSRETRKERENLESNEKKMVERTRASKGEKRDPKEALNDKGPIRTEVEARAPLFELSQREE